MPFDKYFQRKYLLLNLINHLGPISRIDLIEITDYRPATVNALINELLNEKLVVEAGYEASTHGRKRVLLEINKEYICGMGISISRSRIDFIVAQFDGQIIHESTMALSGSESDNERIDMICVHAKNVLRDVSESKHIIGVGLCRALYDPTNFNKEESNNPFGVWVPYSLLPRLGAQIDCPVYTFNNTYLPAVAEHRYGVAQDSENFIWIELSNGIGSSIFCQGNAIQGGRRMGQPGEIGHMVYDHSENARLCYCGKPGCVEAYTAWPALLADIQEALSKRSYSLLQTYGKSPEELTIQDVRRALDEGDTTCQYYVRRAAQRLGITIANAVNLLNPDVIVLYGFMLELGDYYLEHLERSIRENVLSFLQYFDIRISNTSEHIMPLGAIAEMISSFLHIDEYKWVYQISRDKNSAPSSPEE